MQQSRAPSHSGQAPKTKVQSVPGAIQHPHHDDFDRGLHFVQLDDLDGDGLAPAGTLGAIYLCEGSLRQDWTKGAATPSHQDSCNAACAKPEHLTKSGNGAAPPRLPRTA